METHTRSGLVLPASVKEKEEIQSGYILKTGPGYPIPNTDVEEVWKATDDTKYIGMQAQRVIWPFFLKAVPMKLSLKMKNISSFLIPQFLLLIRDELEI